MALAAGLRDRALEIERVVADSSLDPADRIRELRRIADSLRIGLRGEPDGTEVQAQFTTLLGRIDTYIGDLERAREGQALTRVFELALAREDASIRDDLIQAGIPPEELDRAGFLSHDQLDELVTDGRLEEARAFGLAANFRESLVRRSRTGEFAEKFGAPPVPKDRSGKALPQNPGLRDAPGESVRNIESVRRFDSKRPHDPDVAREQLFEKIRAQGLNDWPEKGEVAKRILGEAKDTQALHTIPVAASPGTDAEEWLSQAGPDETAGVFFHQTSPETAATLSSGKFDPSRSTGYYGAGLYVSPEKSPEGTYGGTDVEMAVRLKNPFRADSDEGFAEFDALEQEVKAGMPPADGTTEWVTDKAQRLTAELKKRGHDGLVDPEGNLVVFDAGSARPMGGAQSPGVSRAYRRERKPVHDQIVGSFLGSSVGGVLGEDHAITHKLSRGGTLTDEEKETVREAARAKRGGERPRVLFMAGGPASGKTSALRASPELEPDSAVLINPDEFKERLPEYDEMVQGGDRYAAMGVHEESSDLAKRVQAEAMDLELNVVVDGTGDSKRGKFVSKMEAMNDAGYEVSALYVTIPTDDAVVRATLRAMKSGRWVPEPELRAQHKNVSANFEDVAELPFLQGLRLYDNSGAAGSGPTLVASREAGAPMHIDDEGRFTAFMDKARVEEAKDDSDFGEYAPELADQTDDIPPERWIQHPVSDSADYLEGEPPGYEQ